MEAKKPNRLKMLVSSTVYGIEDLLEQVYSLLSGFGYEVWCSHKDTVNVYPTRIELWNSGRLPDGITPAELRRPTHSSILANPDISLIFYLHELMERVGRGTYKMVQECRDLGMRPPEWSDQVSGVRLTFHALSARRAVVNHLNERKIALVRDVKPGEVTRAKEYLARCAGKISERQARRDLSDLESAGYLERRGVTTATVYVRTGKSLEFGHSAISGHAEDTLRTRKTVSGESLRISYNVIAQYVMA